MPQTRCIWKTYRLVKKWGEVGQSNRETGKYTGKRFQRQAALRRTNLLFPPTKADIVRMLLDDALEDINE